MEEEYFLDEKVYVYRREGMYVKAFGKLYKRGEIGFVENSSPRQRVYSDKIIRKGATVFVVSYVCKNEVKETRDEASRCFLKENDAEKYLAALAKAISSECNCEQATLSHNQGVSPISNILKNLSTNLSVNFRTPNHNFSVTFLKIIY
jgi:hypothetical protein